MDAPMVKKNLYFPPPLWQRLVALSEREGVAIADVLRRLLSASLGLDEAIMAQVELEADAGDPLPRIKRDVIRQRIAHGELANALSRLQLDVDDLAAADPARQAAWEAMTASVDALHTDTQHHIDTAQALFAQTAQSLAVMHQAMQDLRLESQALRSGLEQLATVAIDLLRRMRSCEQGGEPPAEAVEAAERGERWLNSLEADILAKTGTTERQGQHD